MLIPKYETTGNFFLILNYKKLQEHVPLTQAQVWLKLQFPIFVSSVLDNLHDSGDCINKCYVCLCCFAINDYFYCLFQFLGSLFPI